MPSCWKKMDYYGPDGYCWNCHRYQEYSHIYQVWEALWRDEQNEYESGFCPNCGDKIDTDARCKICKEREDLFEYKNELYCLFCYIIVRVKELLDELEKVINEDSEYYTDIIDIIEDYFNDQYDLPEEYKIKRRNDAERR